MSSVFKVLLLLVCAPAFAQPVYTWRDESGRVHYGDTPASGAVELELHVAEPSEQAKTEARQRLESIRSANEQIAAAREDDQQEPPRTVTISRHPDPWLRRLLWQREIERLRREGLIRHRNLPNLAR